MNIELWTSENVEIGAGCLVYEPISVFVPDNYDLEGNVYFLDFLRQQITAYADDPEKVMTVRDNIVVQFLVEDELFVRLKSIFGDIVVAAVRHFINSEEERSWTDI